jgi:hypothetical protein
MDLWNFALAAIFFCAMGTFAGAAALYLTSTPVRLLAHQGAEIVLFCLFAIALFAVIATLRQTTREITPKRPRASLRLDFGDVAGAVQGHLAGVSNAVVMLARAKSPATVQRISRPFDGAGAAA